MRLRGMKAVQFSATLKAAGVNIFRATAVRKARKAANPASLGLNQLSTCNPNGLMTFYEGINCEL